MAKQDNGERQDKKLSFEVALKRLEEIVEQMEAGDLGLDNLVAAFEEGQALVKQCADKLNEVERRIEVIGKDAAGGVVAKPLSQDQLL